jgi:hypothetical protein
MRLAKNAPWEKTDGNYGSLKTMKKHKTELGNVIILAGILFIVALSRFSARAMDRWTALSMIESGGNDAAIGRAGEVSRFQIKPVLWERYCAYPVSARTNPQAALQAARAIMDERCREFKRHQHRQPTNFEYYVLRNAPAQIRKPGRAVTARAQRFCNLLES